jgi:bifunctional oligoribonuclease and PAP phosphatase NrnA
LDGIVNQLRITRGVECAIFLYQTGMQEYKVSMRSNKIVDVAKIAAAFGGGGHIRAAGCTMNGTFHDVVNNISYYIEQQLQG